MELSLTGEIEASVAKTRCKDQLEVGTEKVCDEEGKSFLINKI
jgi:hypothetical protein